MKKDYIRDYATEAFRFYAQTDMLITEYIDKIRQEAIDTMVKKMGKTSVGGSSIESLLVYADKAIEEKIGEIDDLEAVEKVLMECKAQGYRGKEMEEVIRIVYFKDPKRPIKKGEIQGRITRACNELNISESTAYRYLKKARLLFAHNRGLRAGEVERINYF